MVGAAPPPPAAPALSAALPHGLQVRMAVHPGAWRVVCILRPLVHAPYCCSSLAANNPRLPRPPLPRSGRLAACCDSLGRILLVDTQQTLVVRMLKGYREAQVAWLVCSGSGVGLGQPRSLPPRGLQGGSDASLESLGSLGGSAADLAALEQHERQQARQAWQACGGTAEGEQQQQQQQPVSPAEVAALQQREREVRRLEGQDEQRHSACRHLLVTYAPRRAAVEVWEPRTLTRLASVRCSVAQGLLLQQPARRASGGSVAAPAAARHACNRCFLLDGASLTLTDLTDTLTAAL